MLAASFYRSSLMPMRSISVEPNELFLHWRIRNAGQL
jgi:hypothetical protein